MDQVPMIGAACIVSGEAPLYNEAGDSTDTHIMGLSMRGVLGIEEPEDLVTPKFTDVQIVMTQEFARQLRDGLSEWLNDGGHLHVNHQGVERRSEVHE